MIGCHVGDQFIVLICYGVRGFSPISDWEELPVKPIRFTQWPAVLQDTLKDSSHALNARHTCFVKEVMLFEVLLPFFCRQLATIQQFAADKGSMLTGKKVHEFPCFQVCQFRCGSIIAAAPAISQSQNQDAARNGAADLLFPRHTSTQATGNLQSHLLLHIAIVPEGVKYRLRSVVSTQKLLSSDIDSV
ncbi:MAG TPA: hypothetical protein VHO84_02100 [Syntrophorhabdaceae bacterium]|nr:hypothetical protein [Syntrophorhabdaceae bacterium]